MVMHNNSGPTDFVCEICLNRYDTISRRPYSLVPCGHTFCMNCMNQIPSSACPTCRAGFINKIPNWEITKRLDGSVNQPSAPPGMMVQQATIYQNNNQNNGVLEPDQNCMDDFFALSSKRKCKCIIDKLNKNIISCIHKQWNPKILGFWV